MVAPCWQIAISTIEMSDSRSLSSSDSLNPLQQSFYLIPGEKCGLVVRYVTPKVLAKRILEIAFKSGQVWQLAEVPAGIYAELRNSTISSFLKFIAIRYKASPVKTGIYAIAVPKEELCPICQTAMAEQNRTAGALNKFIRVFWLCPGCKKSKWESYGSPPGRERREKWH